MRKKNNPLTNLLILFFIILISFLFLSCGRISTQPTTLKLNTPSLNIKNYSSSYTSFAAIQIPIQITNSSGFNYQAALQAGSNNIQIPTGPIHIKVGFLALGLNSTYPTACSASTSNSNASINWPQEVLYTELESDFNVNSGTSTISINFQNPFTTINFDHFGFNITTASGAQATNAKISYFNPISGLPLIDPCTNTPFSDTADSLGRIALDLPIYSNSFQFGFDIAANDGSTKRFLPALVRGSTNAQFLNMFMSDGTTTPMNELTDSFLQDGKTIAYRRDVLQKNPRYPDIPSSYTFTAPDSMTGFVNLSPDLGPLTQQYDLLTNRKITIMCQILDNTNVTVLAPFQACKGNIPSIFTYPISLTPGQTYYLSVYLIDTENFYPSDKVLAAPANVSFTYGIL